MTQTEFEKALAVLYRRRMETVQAEVVAALSRIAGRPTRTSRRDPAPGKRGRRRSSAEVEALCEKVFAAVSKDPGSTMMQLAAQLGSSARELHRPMTLLRRAGRVRTAGKKNYTKYFPMKSA